MVKAKAPAPDSVGSDANEIVDRDEMTEQVLSAIRQTGPAAALDRCQARVPRSVRNCAWMPIWDNTKLPAVSADNQSPNGASKDTSVRSESASAQAVRAQRGRGLARGGAVTESVGLSGADPRN